MVTFCLRTLPGMLTTNKAFVLIILHGMLKAHYGLLPVDTYSVNCRRARLQVVMANTSEDYANCHNTSVVRGTLSHKFL